MDKNSVANVYVITKGEYSDYRIASIFLSEEEATRKCAQLNAGMRWGDYEVETYPVGVFLRDSDEERRVPGFRATYDFAKHGLNITEETVVFTDALVSWDTEPTHRTETEFFVVHETKAKCISAIEDYVLTTLAE